MLSMIEKYAISVFCGTPTLLSVMADFKRENLGNTLRHICISGECMDKERGLKIANSFPTSRIYHVYGLTEASPRVSCLPPECFMQYPDCVGVPLKSVSVRLRDENGAMVDSDKEGKLWVRGANVMLGYYNDPPKTAEVLQDGWLCTGDIAVLNEEGFLKIKGRRDNLIIKAGMNVYPAEIEASLFTDARVREVMAYGFDSRHGMQIGIKISGDFLSVEEVRELCKEKLPLYQMPTKIELVDKLQRNGSGKIIREI